jgi:cyclic pyranopterin phosphate synthase
MPSEGVKFITHKNILTFEEIIRIVRIASTLGVKKIRITGGEPLIRRDLPYLIESINKIDGIKDISLTTNGLLLKKYASSLADAGLRRVNISLDSFRDDRYREITRGGELKNVLEGIDAAEKVKLIPIKINMVPIKGFNDDEIEEFAYLTFKKNYHIRFIEFMPIGAKHIWSPEKYISTDEIKERVSKISPITPVKVRKSGPARYFRFEGAFGVIGFISPITHHFCSSCNRLRITSDGKIRPCLFSETSIDIRSAIRNGADDKEIERILRLSIEIKPERHNIYHEKILSCHTPMSKIGG